MDSESDSCGKTLSSPGILGSNRPIEWGVSTVTETLMGREDDTLLGCAWNPGPPSGALGKRATTSQRRTKGKCSQETRGAPKRGDYHKSAGMMQNVGAGMLGALELAGGPRGECT